MPPRDFFVQAGALPATVETFWRAAEPRGDPIVSYEIALSYDGALTDANWDQAIFLAEIVSVPDQGYSLRKNKEGGYGGLNIFAFSPRLTVHYDRTTSQVLAGSGDRPEYEVYDLTGKLLRKVPFRMPEQDVSAEDKTEFESVAWVRNGLASGYIKLNYPKTKPYYTHLLPVKDKGHLVLSRSPHLAQMRGILVDEKGKTVSRFSLDCGENGDLFSVNGRLFAVLVDDEGEFVIREMGYGETGS